MKIERDIYAERDPKADAASDARAADDIAAGRVVAHADVAGWLASWGSGNESPAPPEWLK
jgi:predicted transcriptional regulator